MTMEQYGTIFIYIGGVLLLLLAGRLFLAPLRFTFKLIFNGILGLVGLGVIKLIGAGLGITIAINTVTVVVSMLLGLPGVALLLFLRWLGL